MSQVEPHVPAGSPGEDAAPPALELAPRTDAGQRHRRTPQRGRHATSPGEDFGQLVGWSILGTLVPGLGLIVAGRRTAGRLVVGAVALALLAGGAFALWGEPLQTAVHTLASPDRLLLVAIGLGALALAWTSLVIVTFAVLCRSAALTRSQRALTAILVTALALVGVLPGARAASYALVARDTVRSVFTTTAGQLSTNARRPAVTAVDPWADVPRVNVLLIGSDAGTGREGIRPDTLIVASIDTTTGNTVLFSLPRNLQHVPFPPGSRAAAAFPQGFYCINPQNGVNTECLLNSVWTWAENNSDRFYPGVKRPGLTATVQAVEQVLGLQIDDYVMVDLKGFIVFVDAIGGVRVNITERLPIGGSSEDPVPRYGWIEPGRNKLLNGWHALWFARSRWSTSDYDRMARQRCVIAAVTRQADPETVALNFDKIAQAARQNISTDISLQDLDAWVTLALRVKKAHVRSLAFTEGVIDTVHPDVPRMHSLVRKALQQRSAAPTAAPQPSRTGSGPTTPRPTGTKAPEEAVDVNQVC
jgi:LCP family protein required for cell wall assembly